MCYLCFASFPHGRQLHFPTLNVELFSNSLLFPMKMNISNSFSSLLLLENKGRIAFLVVKLEKTSSSSLLSFWEYVTFLFSRGHFAWMTQIEWGCFLYSWPCSGPAKTSACKLLIELFGNKELWFLFLPLCAVCVTPGNHRDVDRRWWLQRKCSLKVRKSSSATKGSAWRAAVFSSERALLITSAIVQFHSECSSSSCVHEYLHASIKHIYITINCYKSINILDRNPISFLSSTCRRLLNLVMESLSRQFSWWPT